MFVAAEVYAGLANQAPDTVYFFSMNLDWSDSREIPQAETQPISVDLPIRQG